MSRDESKNTPNGVDCALSSSSSLLSSDIALFSRSMSPAGVDRLVSFGDRSELRNVTATSGRSSMGSSSNCLYARACNSNGEDNCDQDGSNCIDSTHGSSDSSSEGYDGDANNFPSSCSSGSSSPKDAVDLAPMIAKRVHKVTPMETFGDDNELQHFGDRQNAFFLAALEGSSSLVEQYLESEPQLINHVDKDGQTALIIASGAGRFDVVRLLHLAGAQVNHRDNTGATPMYRASSKNDVKIMEYLFSVGAQLDIPCKNGFTPLIIASLAGNLDAIRFLHPYGANMELPESNGLTPFLVACAGCGDLDVVRYLKEVAHCDMERAEKNGCTPFILAAGAGHLDVCQYLLIEGADIDAQSDSGFTAAFSACSSGNLEIIQFLYEAGADIERRSNKGSTPLYIATVHGYFEIVHYLHSVGGNIEAADNNGLTPLHAAVGAGGSSIKVFAFLINCGCDITKRDIHERKPLDYARRDPLHMLVSIIASIWHESPFHKACYENDIDSLRVLLEEEGRAGTSYFSLNCVGRDAWTPLHVAAFFNRVECSRLLLEAGANTRKQTFGKQQTALMISCQRNHVEIVRLISRYENNTLLSSIAARRKHR